MEMSKKVSLIYPGNSNTLCRHTIYLMEYLKGMSGKSVNSNRDVIMADSEEEGDDQGKVESEEEEEGASPTRFKSSQEFKFGAEAEVFCHTDPNGCTYLNPERDQLMLVKLNATHLTFEQIDEYILMLKNTIKVYESETLPT